MSRKYTNSEKILSKYKNLNIQIITKNSDSYPLQLKKIDNAPLILYLRGNLKQFGASVAIIGSKDVLIIEKI